MRPEIHAIVHIHADIMTYKGWDLRYMLKVSALYAHIYIYIYISTCINIYAHAHTYIHTHTHTHWDIKDESWQKFWQVSACVHLRNIKAWSTDFWEISPVLLQPHVQVFYCWLREVSWHVPGYGLYAYIELYI